VWRDFGPPLESFDAHRERIRPVVLANDFQRDSRVSKFDGADDLRSVRGVLPVATAEGPDDQERRAFRDAAIDRSAAFEDFSIALLARAVREAPCEHMHFLMPGNGRRWMIEF
jgi:hypothetical protein